MTDVEASSATAAGPPPSYDSVFKRAKAARQDSSNPATYLKSVLEILSHTIGFYICVGVLLAIPISMIVMGVLYLDECPVQHFIPIYLIVIGAFSLCMNILSMLVSIHQRRNPECETTGLNKFYNYANCVFCCFLLAWFIAGNVWIYSTRFKFTETEGAPDYCHPTLYWYAFWITTATYILFGVFTVGICIFSCCVYFYLKN